MLRSPQNSHSQSAQGIAVSHPTSSDPHLLWLLHLMQVSLKNDLLLFQVRQNSSSPTNMSFVDQMPNPKQLSVKFVQVRRMAELLHQDIIFSSLH